MSPMVKRTRTTEGRGPTDILVTRKSWEDRLYVTPNQVRRGDVVVEPTEKEARDPRIRKEQGLAPLNPEPAVEYPADEEPASFTETFDDEQPESALEEFVTAEWQRAVELVQAAAADSDLDALASFHEAESRRSKPRASVMGALAEHGIGA